MSVEIDNSDGISGRMLAKCQFPDNVTNPGSLLFQVNWFFDNTLSQSTETVPFNDTNKTNIFLNKNNIKILGRKVRYNISKILLCETLN